MHAATLRRSAPLHSRLLAWINERFPFANALLFFILYLTTAALAQAAQGGPLQLGLTDGLACLATWSFFLLLRVLDEHKDYQLDCHNHPQRVLQSGLITLDHLKVAGLLAVTAQLALSLWLDRGIGQATYAWLALLAWTLLMAKEFFIGEWLNRHLTWYAVSHMLVMPLLVYWLVRLLSDGLPLWALLVLDAFYFLALWQLGRFLRAPNAKARGHNEAVVALTMLAGYAVLIAVAAQIHGLQLNGL